MRMRKKKNLIPRMEKCADMLIQHDDSKPLQIEELVKGRPIYLEIGCGKGRFIINTAIQNPNVFFIAVEREENALLMALESAKEQQILNLKFMKCDAAQLMDLFAKESISRIYLNFSDPWPPKRQAKRRLTHKNFLDIYKQLLKPGCEIHFKTDNTGLFEFSLNEFSAYDGFRLKNICLDLHASGMDNIMTEYEEKFSSQGMKIYRLEAVKL